MIALTMVVRVTVDSDITDPEGNLDGLKTQPHGSCTSQL
jgi:hypothetical protein